MDDQNVHVFHRDSILYHLWIIPKAHSQLKQEYSMDFQFLQNVYIYTLQCMIRFCNQFILLILQVLIRCSFILLILINWDLFFQDFVWNSIVKKPLNFYHGVLFVLFMGLEDEGIRMPHQGTWIAKSCIRILLSTSGYPLLYQSRDFVKIRIFRKIQFSFPMIHLYSISKSS